MRKRNVSVIAGVLIFLFVFSPYVYFQSGQAEVSAKSVKPSETDTSSSYITDYGIKADILENGRKIGTTNQPITLSLGKHTLSFGEYSDFDTPANIQVEVTPFGYTKTNVEYRAKFGVLSITSKFINDLTQETIVGESPTIWVDQKPIGNGSIILKYDQSSLGGHFVGGGEVPGYVAPYLEEVAVGKGLRANIQLVYHKILSTEDQHIVWLRKNTASFSTIDMNSKIFADRFFQWTLTNKVGFPLCYYEIDARNIANGVTNDGTGSFNIYLAQYSGVLQNERNAALDSLYKGLIAHGIDLEKAGTTEVYRQSGSQESLITAIVKIDVKGALVEQGAYGSLDIFGLDKSYTANIPNLIPNIIPVGMAYLFPTNQVYLRIGDSTREITPLLPVLSHF